MKRLKPKAIAGRISDAVMRNTPFSYIRYNDGEVMFMFGNHYPEKRFFGGIFPEPFRSQLKRDMRKAYENCDVIGITPEKSRKRGKYYNMGADMIGVESQSRLGSARDPIDWHDSNMYEAMIHGKVNVITCHDIKDKLEEWGRCR